MICTHTHMYMYNLGISETVCNGNVSEPMYKLNDEMQKTGNIPKRKCYYREYEEE